MKDETIIVKDEKKSSFIEKLGRFIKATGIVVGILASVATISGLWGVHFGQRQQAVQINTYILAMAQNAPPDQQAKLTPVINVFKAAIDNAVAGNNRTADIAGSLQTLSNAIASVPIDRYSSDNARLTSITTGHVALICNDAHHVAYDGPQPGFLGRFGFSIDGVFEMGRPGVQRNIPGIGVVTLMDADGERAVFDVECK